MQRVMCLSCKNRFSMVDAPPAFPCPKCGAEVTVDNLSLATAAKADEEERTAKENRKSQTLALAIIPGLCALGALVAFTRNSWGMFGILAVAALLGAGLVKVYYDRPYGSTDRADTMPASVRDRYVEARKQLFDYLRGRGRESDYIKPMIAWAEEQARLYGTEITPERAHRIAAQCVENFARLQLLPADQKRIEEFLLTPLRVQQEAMRQVEWQGDTIKTSKGATIVTWRPSSPENISAMEEEANTTGRHLLTKMTEILTAHPDADLAKYAAHFGVEVGEVERTWTQKTDPAEDIFRQLATSATSLVQLEIQLEGVLKKYNVDPESEVGQNIQGIYRAAAAHFADPDSR